MNEYIIKKKNQKGMTENILKDCVMFLNYNPISKGTSSVPSPPIILTEGDRMKIGRRPYSKILLETFAVPFELTYHIISFTPLPTESIPRNIKIYA